jgi:radical SAM protein with 4Fe4S-binding SPASM domain
MIFWESTAACNLTCSHCRRIDEEESAQQLSTDEAEQMFRSASKLGCPVIVFSGGEPLLRDDWEHLAGFAAGLELPTALATNGTLIDPGMAKRIRDAGFRRVSISIDGADPKTHDRFRGLEGAYEAAMRGIHCLIEAGVSTQVNVTVTRHNVEQVDDIYNLAVETGAQALHLFLLVPVGCGATLGQSQQITQGQYERVLNRVLEFRKEGRLEMRATCAPHFYRVAAQKGEDPGRGRGCLCGISVVFVSHKGDVFPCGYLPVDCGSIRTTPLDQIWRDSPIFADLRDYERLKGKCGACDFKATCGGCRARAFAATGDYLDEEPSCAYIPPELRE